MNPTNGFEVDQVFSSQALMEAQFGAGAYVLSIASVHDGLRVVTNLLSSENYPAAIPQISNFDAAQTINCAADFTLSWLPLNSSTNLFISVAVDEASSGETVFLSPSIGNAGALNGTSTSILIPGGTLRAGYSYQVIVMLASLALDTASYPGAKGLSGYNRQTQFMLAVPGTPFPKALQILGLNNGSLQLQAAGEPGRTNILEAATSLATPPWIPLSTNIGTFNFSDPLLPDSRFYRLREASAAGP